MPAHMTQHFSKQQRRGLVFGIGSLLAVSWMASSLISQRTHLEMDDAVTLEGWRISFKTPIGWTEGKLKIDSGSAEEYVFFPISDQYGTANTLLRVRRASAASDATPRDYCNEAIAQLATLEGILPFKNVRYSESKMGDWPACHATIRQTWDVFHDQLGVYAEILSAVDRQQEVTYGYSIELQTFGAIRGREQATWKSVVDSIRVVGG